MRQKTRFKFRKMYCIVFISIILFLILVILIVPAFLSLLTFFVNEESEFYETNDIADYGIYTGNYENEYPQQFIGSFFPEKIEPDYENVQYRYKALHIGPYACEAYLEFTINSSEAYHSFFTETTNGLTGKIFRYDTNFVEYSICDKLKVKPEAHKRNKSDENCFYYFEDDAEMGMILFCHEQQRVIFTAIVVSYDGGYATDRFDCFYSRFNINPLDYSNYLDSMLQDG